MAPVTSTLTGRAANGSAFLVLGAGSASEEKWFSKMGSAVVAGAVCVTGAPCVGFTRCTPLRPATGAAGRFGCAWCEVLERGDVTADPAAADAGAAGATAPGPPWGRA